MHLNSCLIIGRVSKTGPKLTYAASGTPTCTLVIECDELGKSGEVYTTYISAEIAGKFAEQTAEEVEAGDEIQIAGKLRYRSTADKSGAKVSKLVVSTWGVAQRIPAMAGSPN